MISLTPEEVRLAVDAAAGRRAGTVLLRGGRVLNVFTGAVEPGSVLLAGRLIAGTGPEFDAAAADQVVDLDGATVAPGLIDGHLHLESSLVAPREYARAVVPRGVTGLVADPHEIANVAGVAGVRELLAATDALPLEVFAAAPSCVPASPLETAGATLGPADVERLLDDPRVVAVGELMDFPAVVAGEAGALRKAWAGETHDKPVDGHAPGLGGRRLAAYAAAGVGSDHESITREEAAERLRLGMTVMIREGSAARNLDAILPLVTPANAHRFCLVTDDVHPHELLRQGGVDHLVRRAIAGGLEPVIAVQLASIYPARHFGLRRRGAVAPGYLAHLVVLRDVAAFAAAHVYFAGREVARDGRLTEEIPPVHMGMRDTLRLPPLTSKSFALPVSPAAGTPAERGGAAGTARPTGTAGAGDAVEVRAIELIPGQIVTRGIRVRAPVENGKVCGDPRADLVKLAVIERHGRSGRVGLGLLRGLGLARGAIAATVAHDAHNLIVAGVNDRDMLMAARALAEVGGGFCAVRDGEVVERLPLPIAGLISDLPLEDVAAALDRLHAAARSLGVTVESPFMALSFLALAVIPELKLTDHGLVDVAAGRVVDPFLA